MDGGLDVNEHVLPPKSFRQSLQCERAEAGPLDEQDQQIHRLPLEPHATVAAKKLEAPQIEREISKANDLA